MVYHTIWNESKLSLVGEIMPGYVQCQIRERSRSRDERVEQLRTLTRLRQWGRTAERIKPRAGELWSRMSEVFMR